MMSDHQIAIIGSGNWGTTLAVMQARAGRTVALCCRETTQATALREQRENIRSLPGIALPDNIYIYDNYAAAAYSKLALIAVSSKHVRTTCQLLRQYIDAKTIVVSTAKGLEAGTLLRMSEVIADELPIHTRRIAALSGPNLAREIAQGLPTASVLAAHDRPLAQHCATALATHTFRLYTTDDIIGVELGGALKNVVALAAGICDGLSMGSNGKAAIVTRGMAEIVRLGRACGANPVTFSGLSGYGDLFATCVSPLSRNHFVGEQLGRGETLSAILQRMSMVAEGVATVRSAYELARLHKVEMPIIEQVQQVLFSGKDPRAAMEDLLDRAARDEYNL